MELKHEFTVPAGVEETWATFNDIEGVAECFPGATVSSVEEDTFHGSCKVKLGPIALVYNGSGSFVEKDETARRFVIEAKGKDKRGNGTAGAHVTATLAPEGEGTRVAVLTDLAITGKPAQFGRGVIQDVSDKLLGQFTDCLERKLGGGAGEADQDAGPASVPTGAAATSPPTDQDAGPASAPTPTDSTAPMTDNVRSLSDQGQETQRQHTPRDDALDLGATVLPILAKTYWKQVLGALVVLLVLRRLLRRG